MLDSCAATKPAADVRPDPADYGGPPKGTLRPRSEPEEISDKDPSEALELLTKRGRECTEEFLDVLSELGEYTAVIDVIAGHEDRFGVLAGQLIENKMSVHRGQKHPSMTLADVPSVGRVPAGALAIPRFKVATISSAMHDVELHELHGELHLGSMHVTSSTPHTCEAMPCDMEMSARARKRRRHAEQRALLLSTNATRGCWRRVEDEKKGVFYPDGVLITDWGSKAGRG